VQFGRKIMKQSAQHTPTINVPFPEELTGSSCRAPQPGSARGHWNTGVSMLRSNDLIGTTPQGFELGQALF
jgi:hypothetical protein